MISRFNNYLYLFSVDINYYNESKRKTNYRVITNDESADEYESSDFSDGSDSESNFTNSLTENLLNSINSNNTVVSENNRSLDIEILPIVCEDNVIIPPVSLPVPQTLSPSTIPQNKKGPDVFSEKWFYDDNAINSFEHKKFDFDDSNTGVKLDDLPSPLTEYDIFKTVFDEDLVQHIVDETNKFYHFVISNKEITVNSKLNRWTDTNVDEIYSFFAVCLLMSHVKKNKIKEYWTTFFLLSTPAFGSIMSQDRFLLLLRLLHFNDNKNQIKGDRLYKITPIIETLRKKFKKIFKPSQKLCIDESIVEWKGRLSFKQFIPSKRHRFGIKLFVLCDCETGYLLDFIVYCGQQSHIDTLDNLDVSGSVITTLMKQYYKKGHIVYMDNWYTSPTLLKHLSSKKVGACGTVKANRKGMPNLCKKLKRGECKLAITKKSKILACKWKDKRDVLMLSTIHKHQMKKINKNDKLQIKPNCILDYNTNMGLVDKTDMMMSFNGTIRKSVRWYKKIFFHLLDIAILNSGIIYNKLINISIRN